MKTIFQIIFWIISNCVLILSIGGVSAMKHISSFEFGLSFLGLLASFASITFLNKQFNKLRGSL